MSLTPNQVRMLENYAAGLKIKDAAQLAKIPRGTMYERNREICRKLKSDTLMQAVAVAVRRGIIA